MTDIARFPFPFTSDTFHYSTNVEPAGRRVRTTAGEWGGRIIDVDDDYHEESAERRRILKADPTRCTVLPHMRPAAWDALLLMLGELAKDHPDAMELRSEGSGRMTWRNDLLGVHRTFTVGDDDSLPGGPLHFAGTQVQEDIVLLDQREDELWVDAGLVTFAAGWSLDFDIGMNFLQVHAPVPRISENGVITRARQFLMRLAYGPVYRRTNWGMTVGHRLDTSLETYSEWRHDHRLVNPDTIGELLHLRVEVQHLARLAPSGAILFLIRTYLLSLADLAKEPEWRRRFAAVLAGLPADLVAYKGLSRYRDAAVQWLGHSPG